MNGMNLGASDSSLFASPMLRTSTDPMLSSSADSFLSSIPSVIAPPDFKTWCKEQDITEDVAEFLIKEGFTSKRLLAMAEPEDIEIMAIRPRAQHRAVLCAIKAIKAPAQAGPPTSTESTTSLPTTTGSGSILDSLIKSLPTPKLPPGLPITTSAMQPNTVPMPRPDLDPTIHLAPKKNTGKCLEVIDFVSVTVSDEIEQLVSDMGGSTLVLKSGPKKPKLESLSVWQWVVGSLRIHDQLVRSGLLPGEDSRNYLAYVIKLMELNTRFDWVSIMSFDKEYRALQSQYNFKWGTDIPHLSTVNLREKEARFTVNNGGANSNKKKTEIPKQQTKSKQDSNVCKDFNFKGACSYNPCRYRHSCLVPGCTQAHPAIQHSQSLGGPPAQSKNT